MARYSHKGHDTISHKISRYDTIQKCFTVCKNRYCQLQTTAISSPLPSFLLHPLAPLKLDTGRPPTSRAASPDTVPVWVYVSVVTVNRTKYPNMQSFVTARRHRQRDVLNLKWHSVCAFLFFDSVHYVYYLLSSARSCY